MTIQSTDYAVCGPRSSDGEEFKLEKQCSKCATDAFSAAEGALDGNVCKKCDAGYAAEPGSTACWAWWQIFAWLFGVGLVYSFCLISSTVLQTCFQFEPRGHGVLRLDHAI